MPTPAIRRCSCALLMLLLGACGQSGDLYRPDEKPAESSGAVTPTPATPAPEEEKKKEEEESGTQTPAPAPPPPATTSPSTTPTQP